MSMTGRRPSRSPPRGPLTTEPSVISCSRNDFFQKGGEIFAARRGALQTCGHLCSFSPHPIRGTAPAARIDGPLPPAGVPRDVLEPAPRPKRDAGRRMIDGQKRVLRGPGRGAVRTGAGPARGIPAMGRPEIGPIHENRTPGKALHRFAAATDGEQAACRHAPGPGYPSLALNHSHVLAWCGASDDRPAGCPGAGVCPRCRERTPHARVREESGAVRSGGPGRRETAIDERRRRRDRKRVPRAPASLPKPEGDDDQAQRERAERRFDGDPEMPLLWYLRDELA